MLLLLGEMLLWLGLLGSVIYHTLIELWSKWKSLLRCRCIKVDQTGNVLGWDLASHFHREVSTILVLERKLLQVGWESIRWSLCWVSEAIVHEWIKVVHVLIIIRLVIEILLLNEWWRIICIAVITIRSVSTIFELIWLLGSVSWCHNMSSLCRISISCHNWHLLSRLNIQRVQVAWLELLYLSIRLTYRSSKELHKLLRWVIMWLRRLLDLCIVYIDLRILCLLEW